MDKTALLRIGKVVEVEKPITVGGSDALRVRVALDNNELAGSVQDIPWAFPLLPKTFQSVPKDGESAIVLTMELGNTLSQRFYIGPIITQPQYHEQTNHEISRTMFQGNPWSPLMRISANGDTRGAFPFEDDVAVVGRGREDMIMRYNPEAKTSEVDIRAGIRQSIPGVDSDLIGNVFFNSESPAYIQLKHSPNLCSGDTQSLVNIVANKVNIMSNKDLNVAHNLCDRDTLVKESELDNIMDSLHQVPLGDKLLELLEIMKGAILSHVHPWAGMKQCGDKAGYIKRLEGFPLEDILSKYVRVS